jgi:hypothetical protein
MMSEVVRLLSKFSEHVEHGINEMASTLPRTNLSGPDDPAPPTLTMYNSEDDKDIAAAFDPPKVPAWILWGDSSFDVKLNGRYKIGKEIIIGAAFVTADDADPYVSNRQCNLFMRGGIICYQRYNSQDKAGALRQLNGIFVHEVSSVTEQRITAAVGRRKLWGMLEIHVIAVDTFQ